MHQLPSPRQIRALSLARFALARSLCTVLHLPASLAPRAALTHHLHRPAPSMCPSSSAAPSRTPMLSFLSVSARSHRPSLTSPRSRPAGGSNQQLECTGFARTSARRSRQRKMDEREVREEEEEEAAIPSSSRRMLPCLRVFLPHSRTAAASSASHALWPCQSAVSAIVHRCLSACAMPCRMCVSVSRVGSFSILTGYIYVL